MIQRKVLKNGMTVVFKQRKNEVISVAFAVRFGAMNETKENKGIAHFIEHMLYKGTPTRNAQQISIEIERNGGELNGFTSEQVTSYWCKMPSKHINVALEVLGDMVSNPKFDPKEVDKERQVIFEEMKMYKDNPRMHVFEKIKNNLYKGDFAMPIIGTEVSMKENTRDKLKKMFDEIYTPENMVLCVVGDTDFDKLCNFVEKNFKKSGKKASYPKVELRNNTEIEKRKNIDQANVVFAYHIPLPSEEKGHYAAQVLNTLMAGGMSSRLFSEIREKRNMAYAIKGDTASEGNYAYNQIYVGTTRENVEKVKKLILEEFEKVSKELKEDELKQVKEQIIGNYLISLEDSHNILLMLLTSEIEGDAMKMEKIVDNVKAVTLSDVKKLAKIKDYSFFALIPE
ncbi:insulinase family protein [Candidatus Pacearchaeota archaeon]|nr:insulinase family protein [Candidatus Pacearchaeota archaeon]